MKNFCHPENSNSSCSSIDANSSKEGTGGEEEEDRSNIAHYNNNNMRTTVAIRTTSNSSTSTSTSTSSSTLGGGSSSSTTSKSKTFSNIIINDVEEIQSRHQQTQRISLLSSMLSENAKAYAASSSSSSSLPYTTSSCQQQQQPQRGGRGPLHSCCRKGGNTRTTSNGSINTGRTATAHINNKAPAVSPHSRRRQLVPLQVSFANESENDIWYYQRKNCSNDEKNAFSFQNEDLWYTVEEFRSMSSSVDQVTRSRMRHVAGIRRCHVQCILELQSQQDEFFCLSNHSTDSRGNSSCGDDNSSNNNSNNMVISSSINNNSNHTSSSGRVGGVVGADRFSSSSISSATTITGVRNKTTTTNSNNSNNTTTTSTMMPIEDHEVEQGEEDERNNHHDHLHYYDIPPHLLLDEQDTTVTNGGITSTTTSSNNCSDCFTPNLSPPLGSTRSSSHPLGGRPPLLRGSTANTSHHHSFYSAESLARKSRNYSKYARRDAIVRAETIANEVKQFRLQDDEAITVPFCCTTNNNNTTSATMTAALQMTNSNTADILGQILDMVVVVGCLDRRGGEEVGQVTNNNHNDIEGDELWDDYQHFPVHDHNSTGNNDPCYNPRVDYDGDVQNYTHINTGYVTSSNIAQNVLEGNNGYYHQQEQQQQKIEKSSGYQHLVNQATYTGGASSSTSLPSQKQLQERYLERYSHQTNGGITNTINTTRSSSMATSYYRAVAESKSLNNICGLTAAPPIVPRRRPDDDDDDDIAAAAATNALTSCNNLVAVSYQEQHLMRMAPRRSSSISKDSILRLPVRIGSPDCNSS